MSRQNKPSRRLPKIKLIPPSQRTLAEENAVVRQAQANRREAKGQGELTWLPPIKDDGRHHLMRLPPQTTPTNSTALAAGIVVSFPTRGRS